MDRGVEIAGGLEAADHLAHPALVPLLGGAHEVVVGEIQLLRELAIAADHAVGELDRRDPLAPRRPLDVLAVLVGAGQEAHVLAQQAVVARQGIADRGGEDVPDVGQIVHVVDRRGDVVGAVGHGLGAGEAARSGSGIVAAAAAAGPAARRGILGRPAGRLSARRDLVVPRQVARGEAVMIAAEDAVGLDRAILLGQVLAVVRRQQHQVARSRSRLQRQR